MGLAKPVPACLLPHAGGGAGGPRRAAALVAGRSCRGCARQGDLSCWRRGRSLSRSLPASDACFKQSSLPFYENQAKHLWATEGALGRVGGPAASAVWLRRPACLDGLTLPLHLFAWHATPATHVSRLSSTSNGKECSFLLGLYGGGCHRPQAEAPTPHSTSPTSAPSLSMPATSAARPPPPALTESLGSPPRAPACVSSRRPTPSPANRGAAGQ